MAEKEKASIRLSVGCAGKGTDEGKLGRPRQKRADRDGADRAKRAERERGEECGNDAEGENAG
jgi:hypothetical protein